MINTKNAEFRAMLTEATNASFDCGEYEFYAGEKVEENYTDLEEKSTATREKVIETYAELERENTKLREALKWAESYVPKRADCETRRMIESLLPNV